MFSLLLLFLLQPLELELFPRSLDFPLSFQVDLHHLHFLLLTHFVLFVVGHIWEVSLMVVIELALIHVAREVEGAVVESHVVVVDDCESAGVFVVHQEIAFLDVIVA